IKLRFCMAVFSLSFISIELMAQEYRLVTYDMEPYDEASMEYLPMARYEFNYSENRNSELFDPIQENFDDIEFDTLTFSLWIGGTFQLSSEVSKLYNADGNCISRIEANWDGQEFVDSKRALFVYD